MLNDVTQLEQEIKALEKEKEYFKDWCKVYESRIETKDHIINQLETNRDKTLQVINTQLKNAKYKDNLRIIKFHLIKGSCNLNDLKTEEDYQY